MVSGPTTGGPVSYDQPTSPRHFPPPPYRQTNVMAMLSMIFAFVFPPLGIIFGVLARRQIRVTGEDGGGLALAGLITSLVFTALVVGYVVLVASLIVSVFSTAPQLPAA
jgi:uncharacterized Tic20 family protein